MIILEIDHIFICVNAPEEKAAILRNFGLTEGETNTHPGQGTANHRFFLSGFFIELLYIDNIEQVKSKKTAQTKLYNRFFHENDNTSPFGVIFRPCGNEFEPNEYPSTEYKPNFLPKSLSITRFVAPISDPLFMYFDFLTPSSRATYTHHSHPIGFEKMTNVRVLQPIPNSILKQDLAKLDVIDFAENSTHMMEITFDEGKMGKTHDFSPELPLIFKW